MVTTALDTVVGTNGHKNGAVAYQISEEQRQRNIKRYVDKATLEDLLSNPLTPPEQKKIIERLHDPSYVPFRLEGDFVAKYSKIEPDFGGGGLGKLTYRRTYSRIKDDGNYEEYFETVERVVNGTMNMQKRHALDNCVPWSDYKAQEIAKEMYDRMFKMKFTPPGRGFWAMGSTITEKRGLYAALNNCAFVSTDNLKEDLADPFTFLMDASMLGVGVGFDTKGAGSFIVKGPDSRRGIETYTIPDSREGWVESVRRLLQSHFLGITPVEFNYDNIREAGRFIKGFGGLSSGPEPLKKLHKDLKTVLDKNQGKPITARTIVDIQNYIGTCVVAGNVRRTAEIAFGDPYSEEYLDLKNYKLNPERENHGWASNNSVFAELGMNYEEIAKRIMNNGEPGLAWLENMRAFGRMGEPPNNKDKRAKGGNPCLEQTLESYELCCLVETYPARAENLDDFLRTLKFAYLYAKTVTLGKTHWPQTNKVMGRNRRIGTSITGIAQYLGTHSMSDLKQLCEEGYKTLQHYDEIYSDEWMAIPRSRKMTSIKPSGTVSLLPGATSGIHYPEGEYWIKNMRFGSNSDIIPVLRDAGYKIEPDVRDDNKSTLIVSIPVHSGKGVRSVKDVSMWEQLSLAAFMQKHWADNQVSATITFDPETEGPQIAQALNYFQYQLKGISFLPSPKHAVPKEGEKKAFDQMPQVRITKEQYDEMVKSLKPIDFSRVYHEDAEEDKFCDGGKCELPLPGVKKAEASA